MDFWFCAGPLRQTSVLHFITNLQEELAVVWRKTCCNLQERNFKKNGVSLVYCQLFSYS